MSAAIIVSVVLAALAGLALGFGKHWKTACLFASLAVPFASAAIFGFIIPAPTWFDKVGWAAITFLAAFVCAFLAWGTSAGVNYGAQALYCKLTHRSRATP